MRTLAGMARGRDLLPAVLAGAALVGWLELSLGPVWLDGSALCVSGGPGTLAPPSLAVILAIAEPFSMLQSWLLMLLAMMPPLLLGPLRHLRDGSFADRRGRASALFVAGYALAWSLAGIPVFALAVVLQLSTAGVFASAYLALALALVWQMTPGKQSCLNGCHRRPTLSAFGLAADRDALNYGLVHGAWCVGSCWALMLIPLVLARGHLLVMAAVSAFIVAESLEAPGKLDWGWRGPGKTVRIVAAQLRLRG